MLAQSLNKGGHDAPAPKRLRQPVADFASVGLADLEAVEATAADQGVVSAANRPMNRTALLPGRLGDESQPGVGSGGGVGEGNAEGADVDVVVVEMFDQGILVR